MELEAKANYEEYLFRMAQSANESTKSLLPLYFQGRKRILDVGCADGTMMEKLQTICPEAKITGLDICHKSVEKARAKGFTVYEHPIEDLKDVEFFDAILFSSVLHEISSYCTDSEKRFDVAPIESALRKAMTLLKPGGIVVIRDGVECGEEGRFLNFTFKKPEDKMWILKFMETEVSKFMGSHFYFDVDGSIQCDCNVFRELMFKYTWGEGSWERESQEKVGILTQYDWLHLAEHIGFKVSSITTSSERYYEYLRPKVESNYLEDAFKDAMILMVLEK